MLTNYREFSCSPVNTPDFNLNPRFETPGFYTFNLGATDSLKVGSNAQLLSRLFGLGALFFVIP